MRGSPSQIRYVFPWFSCLSLMRPLSLGQFRFFVEPDSAGALTQVKLGQLQVARLGNLQINLRTVYYGYRISGALQNRGFVRAHKPVRGSLGKGRLQQPVAKSLRSLRQHHEFARDGGGDQCPM